MARSCNTDKRNNLFDQHPFAKQIFQTYIFIEVQGPKYILIDQMYVCHSVNRSNKLVHISLFYTLKVDYSTTSSNKDPIIAYHMSIVSVKKEFASIDTSKNLNSITKS